MPTEVFYYRDEEGHCATQSFLDRLEQKDMARCLSQIDLLEGEDLPVDIDRELKDTPLRALSARFGRSRCWFTYAKHGDQLVIVMATEGKLSKLQRSNRDQIKSALAVITAEAPIPAEYIKSHREFVAEMTLSDPTLAALYSRARETAQFAISFIHLRMAAGFTPDTLAERTGMSVARVESLERGRMPKIGTMRRLVDALQARIVIAPGTGLTLEPYVEPKRPVGRSRRASMTAPPVAVTADANGAQGV